MMIPEGKAKHLRIHIGEADKWEHQPLYEALVIKAREHGLAGASVLRGAMGYGGNSHMHTAKILRLSVDLPIIIDIVDSAEKINAFLPVVEEMVAGGLATVADVDIVFSRQQPPGDGESWL